TCLSAVHLFDFYCYFFFDSCSDHPDLHSFPARRSSDLAWIRPHANLIFIGGFNIPFVVCIPITNVAESADVMKNVLIKTIASTVDRKSTRLNSSHVSISYAVFCLKNKNNNQNNKLRTTQ